MLIIKIIKIKFLIYWEGGFEFDFRSFYVYKGKMLFKNLKAEFSLALFAPGLFYFCPILKFTIIASKAPIVLKIFAANKHRTVK